MLFKKELQTGKFKFTNTFNLKLLFVGLFCTLIVSVEAQIKNGVVWSYDAMAAVPETGAIQKDLFRLHGGRVIFSDNKSGMVTLFCPITKDLGALRSLYLTYRDGDGRQGPSEVKAALRRVNRKTGAVTSFKFGEVSSNDLGNSSKNFSPAPITGSTGWGTHQSAHAGETLLNQNHQMDLSAFYYYVQISMKRTDPNVPLAVMGVYLHN